VRQGSAISYGADDFRDLGGDDLAEEITRGSGRIGSGDDGAHDGNAVKGLGRGAGSREDGAGVGAVDAADTNSRYGAVAGGRESGEDLADTGGADDGLCILLAGIGG
jgi:hypothetical protein